MSLRKVRFKGKILSQYFDFINDQAKCKLCKNVLKANRLFNLKVHLRKLHNITEDTLKNNAKEHGDGDVPKIKVKRKPVKVEACKKELIRSYIGLVVDDNMPFELLCSENLAVLTNPVCQGISAKWGNNFSLNSVFCKDVLKSVADNFRSKVRTEVYQRLLSLKVESASCLSNNFFGISIQLVNKGIIISHVLGIAEMKGSGISASQSLVSDILKILSSYDISLSQIISITSDNSADIVKASQIVSPCDYFDEFDEGNKIYLKNMQLFKDSTVVDLGDIQITRCLAYAAQMCVLDVIQEPEIASFVFSCRNFVKFLQNPSNCFEEYFEQQNLMMPQLDCATKWGSTYSMIETTKDAKNISVKIEPIQDKSVDENFVLNDSFWSFVEAFCIVFEPLQLAINKFQEEIMHFGNFYAEWLKCKLCTEKILRNNSNTQVKNIAKMLLQSMENQTKELLSNESLLACLFLDPRFNHTLTLTKKLQAIAYFKKMYEKIKIVTVQIDQIKTEEISIAPSSSFEMDTTEFSHKADEYLTEYLTKNFVPQPSEGRDVALKLENLQLPFCRVDSNVLDFWLERQISDPEVYALSNLCFGIPANQISIEETFSSLRHIFHDVRNNLDVLENIMIVKQNPTYLDDAINDMANRPSVEEQDKKMV